MTILSFVIGILIILAMIAIYNYVSTITDGIYLIAKDAIDEKKEGEQL
jgi:hypothetical protein